MRRILAHQQVIGDVSIMTEGFQPIALTAGMTLQAGSSIRTGQTAGFC